MTKWCFEHTYALHFIVQIILHLLQESMLVFSFFAVKLRVLLIIKYLFMDLLKLSFIIQKSIEGSLLIFSSH